MGFITGNTNEFVVYLTDKGKETFFGDGLANSSYYFSISDTDSNYNVLTDPSFNPTLTNQDIITINDTESLTNGFSQVFTQTNLRGSIVEDKMYKKSLFGINGGTPKSYVMFEPSLGFNTSIQPLTYKTIGSYKQYFLLDLDGLYLRTAYPKTVTLSDLIQNYDLFPIDNIDIGRYSFINSSYQQRNAFIDLSFLGNNSQNRSNNNVLYSQVLKADELVIGENYHSYFNFYFRFAGVQNLKYNPTGSSENLTVTVNLLLGANKIPMTLTNLQQYRTTGSTFNFANGIIKRRTAAGFVPLVSLTNSNKSILMNYSERTYTYSSTTYTITDHFEDYNKSPNGYNFRVKASLDLSEFYSKNRCLSNNDFAILVEYSKLSKNYVIKNLVTTTYPYASTF